MSDDKKPKKDLRARLGRTITPNTPGAPAIATPIVAPKVGAAAAVAPPPAVGGPQDVAPPPVAAPVIAPPAIAAPPVGGGKSPFGGADIAPPPFARPQSEPPKPKPPSDPFAAGAPAQEVRIVFDDKTAVSDSEVGRTQRGRTFIVAGLCLAVGAALGGGGGSMNGRRQIHNMAVRDGHEIYDHVNTASSVVLEAQTHLDAIVSAAGGGAGGTPSVAYAEIEALQALENPLVAGMFSRLNYNLFAVATVDDLFHYYNNVLLLWERFERIAARTLPPARRAELDRTATALGSNATATFGAVLTTTDGAASADTSGCPAECPSAASAMFGAVLSVAEGNVVAQLAFLEPVMGEDGAPTGHVLARGTRTGAGRDFEVYTGEEEITDSPTHVLLVDGAGSRGVLAEQAGAFTDFVREIQELHALMEETVQVQGELTTALSALAREEEIFAL